VRSNLVYREFTRVGGEKVPDDRTMGNPGRQLGPEVIEQLNRRMVEIAQEHKIAAGRKMRVDTTVVETDIHYPTDSTLLGDGVRVLTRIMKRVAGAVGKVGRPLRDRSRSAKLEVLAIARASRNKSEQGREKERRQGKVPVTEPMRANLGLFALPLRITSGCVSNTLSSFPSA
jgi:IS5 family transposase